LCSSSCVNGTCDSGAVIGDELLRVLSSHSGCAQAFAEEPAPLTGGFWAAIYGFALQDPPPDLTGRLVLRVMPGREAAVRETIVQRAVAEQGYPTPRVLLDGFDEGLGGMFMVMQRADGAPLLDDLGIGRTLWTLPKMLRRVARQLSLASTQLHDLDPAPVVVALSAAGAHIPDGGVESRLAEIRGAAQFAGFGALSAWLTVRRPDMTPGVVCHGDIHPFNMLTTDDESFTLLDWTNANICRRELDVGFTAALLQTAPMDVPSFAKRPVAAVTGALARRFIDTYRKMAPVNLDVVEWFEVLQYGRCLAAVAVAPLDDPIVSAKHPFRAAATAMAHQLRVITDVDIRLPTPD
jgi:aminoglycoside phosphotransferase (APT) family kinase protein